MNVYNFQVDGIYKDDDIIRYLKISEEEYYEKISKYKTIRLIFNFNNIKDIKKFESMKIIFKFFNVELIERYRSIKFIYNNYIYPNFTFLMNIIPLEKLLFLEQEMKKCVEYVTYFSYHYFLNKEDIDNFLKDLNCKKNYSIYKVVL